MAACGGGGGSSPPSGAATPTSPPAVNPNTAPTAVILVSTGPQVPAKLAVAFDGAASTDANGDTLTHVWTLSMRPAGSAAKLSATTGTRADLIPDVPGDYTVTLVVNDGKVDSAPATSSVVAVNVAPVAVAGRNFSVLVGETGSLDGSASSDANNDPLTYTWTLLARPAGSTAVLAGAAGPRPTFVPDLVGEYDFTLTVHDGLVASNVATVRATATALQVNRAPQANAGVDQNVPVGAVVTLDASASLDPDSDQLTYAWSMQKPAGSAAALSSATALRPTFVADAAGTYVVQLVVSDGTLTSSPDSVTINATAGNSAPTANAGPDQRVLVGAEVQLAGENSSDADGDLLTFAWTISSKPVGSKAELDSIDDPGPTFVADVAGDYVLSLIVRDSKGLDSAADSVTVTAVVGNAIPVADAGLDKATVVGTAVTLDGSQSSDANADPLTYSWNWQSKPVDSQADLVGSSTVAPVFTPDVPGDYVISLVVWDGQAFSTPDNVVVTVYEANVNIAPVANAGVRQRVAVGTTVQLDGGGSYDPNGTAVTYAWRFKSLPRQPSDATLFGADTKEPTFVADVRGNYVIELVVSDGELTSAPASVLIQARNR
jgi:hypothetical protein